MIVAVTRENLAFGPCLSGGWTIYQVFRDRQLKPYYWVRTLDEVDPTLDAIAREGIDATFAE